MIEQTFSKMREVSIRVSLRRDAFIHLQYVYFPPRQFLSGKGAQHDPGRSAAADGHHEPAPVGNGGTGFDRNRFRRRLCSTCFVGKYFSLHGSVFAS
jgi:hypothetical protein